MNKKQIIVFSITYILFLSFSTLIAQDVTDNSYKRNIIHGSLGTVAIVSTATIFYERILTESSNKSRFTTFARIGLQGTSASDIWGGSGNTYGSAFIAQGGILTGPNRSHFEGALGVAYMMNKTTLFLPSFSLGYRNQMPGKKFMFRIGVGLPELLYVGLGYCF